MLLGSIALAVLRLFTYSLAQIDGTVTVTMKEGPVHGVPVAITLQGDVIDISLDPNMTSNHFGDTPICGIINKLVHIVE